MRYSRALLPTLKEAPADATSKSHVFLLRAGYVRRVGVGMYSFLSLGVRVLRKIEAIVRGELAAAGSQEVLLPPDNFKETGRWELFADTLFRLKDRKGGDYHLGPTHEESITDLARREVKSYRRLPKNLYQIQTKFRDEARPRWGLLRCEAGHIFLLGTQYTSRMSATYLDVQGEQQDYGIGVSRLIAVAVEQHHDKRHPLADQRGSVPGAARHRARSHRRSFARPEQALEAAGIEVLVDDREERPGVKFKDADLIGIPLRASVRARGIKNGQIKFKLRTEGDPKKVELLAQSNAAEQLAQRVRVLLARTGTKAN